MKLGFSALPKPRAKLVWALFVLLCVGAGLRLQHLEGKVFWHDEVYTQIFAAGYQSNDWKPVVFSGAVFSRTDVDKFLRPTPSRGLLDTARALAQDEPQHPPLYYILLRMWALLLGSSVLSLRLFSVSASLLAIPLIYCLALECYRDRRAALGAATLMAVSPFFVLYAQEAREYALWTSLMLASFWTLLRALRLQQKQQGPGLRASLGTWAPHTLFTSLALYTSFSSVGLVLAQALFLILLAKRSQWRDTARGLCSILLAGLAFSPWILALARHFDAFQISMTWSRTVLVPKALLLSNATLSLSRALVDLGPDFLHPLTPLAILLALSLVVAGVLPIHRKGHRSAVVLVLLMIFTPLVMMLVPDLLFGGIRSLSTRYLTLSLLGTLMATAPLFARALPPTPRWPATFVVGSLLLIPILSTTANNGRVSVWTKGVSVLLPEVAQGVAESPHPLVIANFERHNPGNLLALTQMLPPDTGFQVKTSYQACAIPEGYETVFLFSPIPPQQECLRAQGLETKLLLDDLHLSLWRVLTPSTAGTSSY